MKTFLRGDVAAIAVVNDDRDANKRVLAKYLATDHGAILDEPYPAYRGIYPKVSSTTEEQVRSILAVADHPMAAAAQEFFDNRFIKELQVSGFIIVYSSWNFTVNAKMRSNSWDNGLVRA